MKNPCSHISSPVCVCVCVCVCHQMSMYVCLQLLYLTWPTYWVFIGQLVIGFNTYCNDHPRICCKEPNSAYRWVFWSNNTVVRGILSRGGLSHCYGQREQKIVIVRHVAWDVVGDRRTSGYGCHNARLSYSGGLINAQFSISKVDFTSFIKCFLYCFNRFYLFVVKATVSAPWALCISLCTCLFIYSSSMLFLRK